MEEIERRRRGLGNRNRKEERKGTWKEQNSWREIEKEGKENTAEGEGRRKQRWRNRESVQQPGDSERKTARGNVRSRIRTRANKSRKRQNIG